MFERNCKRSAVSPPLRYPPSVSGDSITNNDIAYPRYRSAAVVREGHGCMYVDARNDVEAR